ncbi:hypothetical protein [Nocardiopsis sp. NPDC058789]|uniref:Uncharacterized protein n=1 Tax=Nocardiopsis eucommiae TaxID=2831970 RepID=A0A975QLE4_9ACTN|nr:hypothetical protein KGD82_06730 [Nocardiopsis eucommiae]
MHSAENPQVAALLRWEEHGALWRVVERGDATVTVSMLTCDGGTEVDRITSDDPALLSFIGQRGGSEEPFSPSPPRST